MTTMTNMILRRVVRLRTSNCRKRTHSYQHFTSTQSMRSFSLGVSYQTNNEASSTTFTTKSRFHNHHQYRRTFGTGVSRKYSAIDMDDDEMDDLLLEGDDDDAAAAAGKGTRLDEVEGYFSKLYGGLNRRGGLTDEERLKQQDPDLSDLDLKYLGQPGYHIGMTDERRERWLMKQQLLNQRGRLWSDPLELTDDIWTSDLSWDEIEDWTPDVVSQLALSKVHVLDTIPTLKELAKDWKYKLPPQGPPVVADNKKGYTLYRIEKEQTRIKHLIKELAHERLEYILQIKDPLAKQDALDELFESVEDECYKAEGVHQIQRNPGGSYNHAPSNAKFEHMVEDALSEFLKEINVRGSLPPKQEEKQTAASTTSTSTSTSTTATDDAESTTIQPVFMDLMKTRLEGSSKGNKNKKEDYSSRRHGKQSSQSQSGLQTRVIVEERLFPVTGISGLIKEEWEMSAHGEHTKRILLRQCMSNIAQTLIKNEETKRSSKIFLQGRRGVGKSAVLNALVATLRDDASTENIVLFVNGADRFREWWFYIEPSTVIEGMYDLPRLTKEFLLQLKKAHSKQMSQLDVDDEAIQYLPTSIYDPSSSGATIPTLLELCELGSEDDIVAPGCYLAVITTLKHQTQFPFYLILDEYNVYFQKSEYYHASYDPEVNTPIPLHLTTLFQPLLSMGMDASIIPPVDDNSSDLLSFEREEIPSSLPPSARNAPIMKRGAYIAALTYSRPVSQKINNELCERIVKYEAASEGNTTQVVDVPRFSHDEVEAIIANYEAVGMGHLRFDKGEILSNPQEIEFYKMKSSSIGHRLLDACLSIH